MKNSTGAEKLPFVAIWLFFLPFLSGAAELSAQTTLSGKVEDAHTKAALAFVSVILKTEKDSAFVAGAITDEVGAFVFSGLKKGNYR
jgi:hypothetical protein